MVGKASISPTTKGDDQASTGPVEKGDDQTSTGPKYTDADQLGIRFIICLLLYTALIFGAELRLMLKEQNKGTLEAIRSQALA